MKIQKLNWIIVIILLVSCIAVYGDTYSAGTLFTPTQSNVTYNLSRQLTCDHSYVGSYCFNISGGLDAHNYCTLSNTPITILILMPPIIESYQPLTNPSIEESCNQTFNITVSDIDGMDYVTYSWKQNGSEVATTQNFTFIGNGSSAGAWNISVLVFDRNGTDYHEWTLTVNDSILLPVVIISKTESNVEYGIENNTIYWTSSSEILDTVIFNITYPNDDMLYSTNIENGSILLQPINLTQLGIYNINLFANDTNGNYSIDTDTFRVRDTISPTLDQPLKNREIYKNTSIRYDINASDNYMIKNFTVSDIENFTINSSGFLQNITSLRFGSYNLIINITDPSNNFLLAYLNITVNNLMINVTYYNLTPIEPSINDNLLVWVNCNDLDDISVTAYVQFYNNTITYNSVKSLIVNSNKVVNFYNLSNTLTTEYDNWTAEVWCSDSINTTNKYNISRYILDSIGPELNIILNDTILEFGNDSVQIQWTSYDKYLDKVELNVTYPDGSLMYNSVVENDTINFVPSNLSIIGVYNIILCGNDTSNNINITTSSFRVTISQIINEGENLSLILNVVMSLLILGAILIPAALIIAAIQNDYNPTLMITGVITLIGLGVIIMMFYFIKSALITAAG